MVVGNGTRFVVITGLVCSLVLIGLPAAQAQDQASNKRDAVVDLINHARVKAGLLPLARSAELDDAAQAHSGDMVQHNYLDHTGVDGSEPQTRADMAGYHVPANTGWIVVEVISAISGDPEGPVNWWMNDEQHQKVLMNPRWREIGVGYAQGGDYGNYWTADVGCRPGVLPTVTLDGQTYTHTEQCGDPTVATAVAPTPIPTLAPSPRLVQSAAQPRLLAQLQGQDLRVTWDGIAQPTATDWLGVYRSQDADANFLQWEYVSCTTSPDFARRSGSCTISAPYAMGTYDVRIFSGNQYTQIARSSEIALAGANPRLSVSTDVISPGAAVNVRWQGLDSPTATDWIGLYLPGSNDTQPIVWLYVGCDQTPLDARQLGSCNVLLPSTLSAGDYEFRLFSGDAYRRLAASPTLRVR